MNLRDLLSKLRWDPREHFQEARIVYMDRTPGRRGGTTTRLVQVRGRDVVAVERGYITIRRGEERPSIPLHRIVKVISSTGRELWSREGR
jgi:uncharacterized protein (UPF0248 family)